MPEKAPPPSRREWVSRWASDFERKVPSYRYHGRSIHDLFDEDETLGRLSANLVTLALQGWIALWCCIAAGFRLSVMYPLIMVPPALIYPLLWLMEPGQALPAPKPEDRVEYEYWEETRRLFKIVQWIFLVTGSVISGIAAGAAGAGPWEIIGRLLFQAALGYALMRIFPVN